MQLRLFAVVSGLGAVLVSVGCGSSGRRTPSAVIETTPSSVVVTAPPPPEAPCEGGALFFTHGTSRVVCPDAVARQQLTIVDLGDAWTPSLLADRGEGAAPAFRATYLQLATERDAGGQPLAAKVALGELYGVVPSLSVVRERLGDTTRHACRADVDRNVVASESKAGVVAAQQAFACEGYLARKDATGGADWKAEDAVELFQRRNFLLPTGRLDAETREALAQRSRELDFRLALRVLRERVADATGLIEDGTAGAGPQPILGRLLDPTAMRDARGSDTLLPNAAPDLVGAATEAAATALGWTDAAAVAAFLTMHPTGARVALALPAAPAYHSAEMALTAEIDRGDVFYDATPKARRAENRPTLVLYVDDGGTKRALLRWPTTIGGWSNVTNLKTGKVERKWKESDVGPRVWRNLYAAPTWLPPPSTPDRDLVTNLYNGTYELRATVMGPGPRAAYGIVMLQHDKPLPQKDGSIKWWNNSIATHGSSTVTSVANGTSHGCHRLYNQLAVRLADFLLRHRKHTVRGQQAVDYQRTVTAEKTGQTFEANVDSRGFLYELTPPVPVIVTPGNIKTPRKTPPKNAAPASE